MQPLPKELHRSEHIRVVKPGTCVLREHNKNPSDHNTAVQNYIQHEGLNSNIISNPTARIRLKLIASPVFTGTSPRDKVICEVLDQLMEVLPDRNFTGFIIEHGMPGALFSNTAHEGAAGIRSGLRV